VASKRKKLAVIGGDGIGPSVTQEASALLALIVVVACASDDTSAQTSPRQRRTRSTVGEQQDKFIRAAATTQSGGAASRPSSRPALRPAPGRSGAPKSAEEAEMMAVEHPATQPVPLLSADETIPTFKLPPGLRIQAWPQAR
jgi:hypothetical protein